MNHIFDVIDKLELIKHYHLINVVEKYTQQVASATTPPATTPPAATAATPPAATPPVATPPATPVPPAEEAKKPPTEFENNMMDSLKWVFIGIAIFVFLLIILGVVYWLMFGSSNSNSSSNPENAVREDGENGVNGINGVNGMNENGENGDNGVIYNPPPPENYQEPSREDNGGIVDVEDVDNKESSMFSSLSSFSPFSGSKEPVVEPIVEPILINENPEPPTSPVVIPVSPVSPVSVLPINNVIEEVKK